MGTNKKNTVWNDSINKQYNMTMPIKCAYKMESNKSILKINGSQMAI